MDSSIVQPEQIEAACLRAATKALAGADDFLRPQFYATDASLSVTHRIGETPDLHLGSPEFQELLQAHTWVFLVRGAVLGTADKPNSGVIVDASRGDSHFWRLTCTISDGLPGPTLAFERMLQVLPLSEMSQSSSGATEPLRPFSLHVAPVKGFTPVTPKRSSDGKSNTASLQAASRADFEEALTREAYVFEADVQFDVSSHPVERALKCLGDLRLPLVHGERLYLAAKAAIATGLKRYRAQLALQAIQEGGVKGDSRPAQEYANYLLTLSPSQLLNVLRVRGSNGSRSARLLAYWKSCAEVDSDGMRLGPLCKELGTATTSMEAALMASEGIVGDIPCPVCASTASLRLLRLEVDWERNEEVLRTVGAYRVNCVVCGHAEGQDRFGKNMMGALHCRCEGCETLRESVATTYLPVLDEALARAEEQALRLAVAVARKDAGIVDASPQLNAHPKPHLKDWSGHTQMRFRQVLQPLQGLPWEPVSVGFEFTKPEDTSLLEHMQLVGARPIKAEQIAKTDTWLADLKKRPGSLSAWIAGLEKVGLLKEPRSDNGKLFTLTPPLHVSYLPEQDAQSSLPMPADVLFKKPIDSPAIRRIQQVLETRVPTRADIDSLVTAAWEKTKDARILALSKVGELPAPMQDLLKVLESGCNATPGQLRAARDSVSRRDPRWSTFLDALCRGYTAQGLGPHRSSQAVVTESAFNSIVMGDCVSRELTQRTQVSYEANCSICKGSRGLFTLAGAVRPDSSAWTFHCSTCQHREASGSWMRCSCAYCLRLAERSLAGASPAALFAAVVTTVRDVSKNLTAMPVKEALAQDYRSLRATTRTHSPVPDSFRHWKFLKFHSLTAESFFMFCSHDYESTSSKLLSWVEALLNADSLSLTPTVYEALCGIFGRADWRREAPFEAWLTVVAAPGPQ